MNSCKPGGVVPIAHKWSFYVFMPDGGRYESGMMFPKACDAKAAMRNWVRRYNSREKLIASM